MDERQLTFRKPGRPREDRVERRLEIFTFVAPSVERLGPRLTMREAARAAHVSIGTLYYYFDSKRDLLLYGLNQEAVPVLCRQFEAEHGELRGTDPRQFRAALLDFLVATLTTMRASVDSAIRLGPAVAKERIDRVMHQPMPEFVALIDEAIPGGHSSSVEPLLRRVIAAALMERDFSADTLRGQLQEILEDAAPDPAWE